MKVEKGFDGGLFLVFNSECEADDYSDWLFSVTGCRLSGACFGGYFNALELPMVDCTTELLYA